MEIKRERYHKETDELTAATHIVLDKIADGVVDSRKLITKTTLLYQDVMASIRHLERLELVTYTREEETIDIDPKCGGVTYEWFTVEITAKGENYLKTVNEHNIASWRNEYLFE